MKRVYRSAVQKVRWNWSRRGKEYAAADAFLVSIKCSGRTWVEVFMDAYQRGCAQSGKPFPNIAVAHDRYEHATHSKPWQRFCGRYLIPPPSRWTKPIAVLARDPRDLMVSLFFHVTKREGRFNGSISTMLRHPLFGVRMVIEVMNAWMAEWGRLPHFHLFRYEDCRVQTEREFRSLLTFYGISPIDDGLLAECIRFSSFDNMKKMEAKGEVKEFIIKPVGDATDPEASKVRRGKVGGYAEHLIGDDLLLVEMEMQRLDPRFGYGEKPASSNAIE